MKAFKTLLILLAIVPFLQSCEKEETDPERTTHVVTLHNNTGITGCAASGLEVTFIVTYRDISVDVAVEEGRSAIINVLVEDQESIRVKVQKTSDDVSLADANVVVRTDSRPGNLENEIRRIYYCKAFDLDFLNF